MVRVEINKEQENSGEIPKRSKLVISNNKKVKTKPSVVLAKNNGEKTQVAEIRYKKGVVAIDLIETNRSLSKYYE